MASANLVMNKQILPQCLSSGKLWTICSSVWEKLLKFKAEDREFAKNFRSLEQLIQTLKGQKIFW